MINALFVPSTLQFLSIQQDHDQTNGKVKTKSKSATTGQNRNWLWGNQVLWITRITVVVKTALLHFISPKNFYITNQLLYHQSNFYITKKLVALNKIFSTEFMVIRNNWAHTFKGTASGGFAPSPFEKFFNPPLVEAGFVGGGSGVLSADSGTTSQIFQRLWTKRFFSF